MATEETSDTGIRTYKLTPYARHHGNSGVVAYAIGSDYIVVQFKSGDAYLYTAKSTGREQIEEMKRSADAGQGLSAYISRHQDRYERTLHAIGPHLVQG